MDKQIRFIDSSYNELFTIPDGGHIFIIDKNGEPYFIEINTSPGMTDVSLFPESAKSAGMDFPLLVDKIVKLAI